MKLPDWKKILWLDYGLLLLITGFFALVNYCMVQKFGYYPQGDASDHVVKSIVAYRNLLWGNCSLFCWGDNFYPPLLYQTSALFYLLFPPSIVNAVMSQSIYWLILAFSLYGIGKLLFNRLTGFLAVFFFFTAPLTLLWSFQYMLDIPPAAMLALAVYLLLSSEDFQKPFYSYAFGAVLGLGMLLKWWVGYLLAGMIVYYFFRLYFRAVKKFLWQLLGLVLFSWLLYLYYIISANFKPLPTPQNPDAFMIFSMFAVLTGIFIWFMLAGFLIFGESYNIIEPQGKNPMLNFTGAMCLALVLCGWLYLNPNFALLNGKLFEYGAEITPEPWPGLGYYPRALLFNALRWGYLPFFLAGLVSILNPKRWDEKLKIFLLTFFSVFVLMVLPANKQERYLLSWLALASPLAVFWIAGLKRLKIPALVLLLGLGSLYLAAGWLIPHQAYRRNPLLRFIVAGNPPFWLREEVVKPDIEALHRFMAPLPGKGEWVCYFNCLPQVPLDYFRSYPYLFGVNVHIPRTINVQGLNHFQYIIYAQSRGKDVRDLINRLKQNDSYFDAEIYDFPTLSVYSLPGTDYEIRLAGIKSSRRGLVKNRILAHLLSALPQNGEKIYWLNLNNKLAPLRPYFSQFKVKFNNYPKLGGYKYLLYCAHAGASQEEVYRQLRLEGRCPDYLNYEFPQLAEYLTQQTGDELRLVKILLRTSPRNFVPPAVKAGSRVLLLGEDDERMKFLFPFFKQKQLDLGEYPKLDDYQYLVHLHRDEDQDGDLIAKLKLDDRFSDAGRFRFPIVSTYPLKGKMEVRLCRVMKVKFLEVSNFLNSIERPGSRLLLLGDEDEQMRALLPVLDKKKIDTGEYEKLEDYQYLIYLCREGEKEAELIKQLKLDDRFLKADKFRFPVLTTYPLEGKGELRLCKIVPPGGRF